MEGLIYCARFVDLFYETPKEKKQQQRQTRERKENGGLHSAVEVISYSIINAHPPARNQRMERGASPRGCPSSNPTLASVPSSQLTSQLAMSSSQRQPHKTRNTTCIHRQQLVYAHTYEKTHTLHPYIIYTGCNHQPM